MKSFKPLILITLLTSNIFYPSLQAQPQPKSALSDTTIQKMLNSFEAIKAEFKHQETRDAKSISHYIQANNAIEKANQIVQKHGYENFLQWQADLMRVALAYAAYQQKLQQPQQADIQAQIEKIRNNPNISKEQKASLINMMEAANTMASNLVNTNDKELALIEKYQKELGAVFVE